MLIRLELKKKTNASFSVSNNDYFIKNIADPFVLPTSNTEIPSERLTANDNRQRFGIDKSRIILL